MTDKPRHFHPAAMLLEAGSLLKSMWPILIAFVFNLGREGAISKFIIAVFCFFILLLLAIPVRWWVKRYEVKSEEIVLYTGVFVRAQRAVPFKKVQNIQQKTNVMHRLFGLTALQLETGTSGGDGEVKFPAISRAQADEIKCFAERARHASGASLQNRESAANSAIETASPAEDRAPGGATTVHFRSTTKGLIRASFASFSFLATIPVAFAIYSKAQDFFPKEKLERTSETVWSYLHGHLWLLVPLLLSLFLLSLLVGLATTFLKYGNFSISSNRERIFIQKGLLTQSHFSIQKQKVQAISLQQGPIKRVLGMVEVQLLSAGDVEEDSAPNTLYPYLPVAQAHALLGELLPDYEIEKADAGLPKRALFAQLVRPYWITLLLAAALYIFWRPVFWWVVPAFFALAVLERIYDYRYTRYHRSARFLHLRTGGIVTTSFIVKRVKVQEIAVKQSWLEQRLGLSTFELATRQKPSGSKTLRHIEAAEGAAFYRWFLGRAAAVSKD